ncbi:MAG: GNAT family N-acyltransferase [Pseudomonadota bacterium]
MPVFSRGRYRARFSREIKDVEAAQKLRFRAFRGTDDEEVSGLDADDFDQDCIHVLIEEVRGDRLVCCFRMLPFENGSEIERSYSAQYYELSALRTYEGRMVEMGRFCVLPGLNDPDILRVAWAAMTKYVDENGVDLLFGCSSFWGTEAETYKDAFALLKEKHLAPKRWLPRVKAPKVFRFAKQLRLRKPDLKQANKGMPPLLRSYLVMGGWVSDHAVVDNDLNTLHVFTGLEIKGIPPGRARLLRMSAA